MLRKTLCFATSVLALMVVATGPAGARSHPSGALGCEVTGHVAPLRVTPSSTKMQLTLNGTGSCPIGHQNGGSDTITDADAVATWTVRTPVCAQPFGNASDPKRGMRLNVTWSGSSGVVGKATIPKTFATQLPDGRWYIGGNKIKSADFKGNRLEFILSIDDPNFNTDCASHPNQPADTDVTGFIWTL